MGLLESLKRDLLRMLEILAIMKPNKLYETAYAYMGKDASPNDEAPDELGCAESLSRVIQRACPELNFPTILSTRKLYDYFTKSFSFVAISEPILGDIILSVTGTGSGVIPNGHTGIVGKTWILSNDSRTGTWEASFTLASWRRYYEYRGGMPTLFFRKVEP